MHALRRYYVRTERAFAAAVFALMTVMLGGVALAHHSAAHYGREEKQLRGTVVEYKWRNPHVYVVWEVKEGGQARQWIGELASVTSSIADGMTKDSLRLGDEIIVTAYPTKAGTPEALIRRIVKADGKLIIARSQPFVTREP